MKLILRMVIAAWLLHLGTTSFAQSLSWAQVTGAANDVGVGATGAVWIIGNNKVNGGYGVYKWSGSNWAPNPGGAVRIDVDPQGNPWVVNEVGGIYRWNGSSWQQMPGLAKDVGVGANGAVWIIGANAEVGGYGIYRWNAGANRWDKVSGSATRIDVDPNGNAWVVTSAGAVFRFDGVTFVHLPGIVASDIGIGGNGAVFVVGPNGVPHFWTGSGWAPRDGILTSISVDPAGRPWGVNPSKQIWLASAGNSAPPGSLLPPPPPPPPAAPPRKGVVVVNNSRYYSWITVQAQVLNIKTNRAAGCLRPGQENSWDFGLLAVSDKTSQWLVVRVERTSTPDCAPLPNNAHVTCDTSASWEKLAGAEAAYRRVRHVIYEFNEGCHIDVSEGKV